MDRDDRTSVRFGQSRTRSPVTRSTRNRASEPAKQTDAPSGVYSAMKRDTPNVSSPSPSGPGSLVGIALILILVLLPAVLAAQAAGSAEPQPFLRLGARDDRAAVDREDRCRPAADLVSGSAASRPSSCWGATAVSFCSGASSTAGYDARGDVHRAGLRPARPRASRSSLRRLRIRGEPDAASTRRGRPPPRRPHAGSGRPPSAPAAASRRDHERCRGLRADLGRRPADRSRSCRARARRTSRSPPAGSSPRSSATRRRRATR